MGCVYVVHAHEYSCIQRPEDGIRAPGTGATGSCKSVVWALRTHLGSSARVIGAYNYSAISPALRKGILR